MNIVVEVLHYRNSISIISTKRCYHDSVIPMPPLASCLGLGRVRVSTREERSRSASLGVCGAQGRLQEQEQESTRLASRFMALECVGAETAAPALLTLASSENTLLIRIL